MKLKLRFSGDLLLATIGFTSAVLIPPYVEVATDAQERAAIAMVVLVLQGAFFWISKCEQRKLLKQTRALLNHKIRNSLQVLVAQLPDDYEHREAVWEAAAHIVEALDHVDTHYVRAEYAQLVEQHRPRIVR